MGFEDGKVLSMGVMGFPPKHHIIAELLEYYNQPFLWILSHKHLQCSNSHQLFSREI